MTYLFERIADIFPNATRAQLSALFAILDEAGEQAEPPILHDVVRPAPRTDLTNLSKKET